MKLKTLLTKMFLDVNSFQNEPKKFSFLTKGPSNLLPKRKFLVGFYKAVGPNKTLGIFFQFYFLPPPLLKEYLWTPVPIKSWRISALSFFGVTTRSRNKNVETLKSPLTIQSLKLPALKKSNFSTKMKER